MVNGTCDSRPAARDFGFQRGDAIVKFLDRKGIEVLQRELSEQIVFATREFVGVHREQR